MIAKKNGMKQLAPPSTSRFHVDTASYQITSPIFVFGRGFLFLSYFILLAFLQPLFNLRTFIRYLPTPLQPITLAFTFRYVLAFFVY
uniref:Uncharacterized protein n=1 Tax=Ciona intestinalis TaxID=7719 RepID=H2XTM6_CIOIN